MYSMYSAAVLQHFKTPRYAGVFPPSVANVGSGEVGAPTRGGVIKLQIKVAGDRIVDVRFQAYGCGYTIAAGSWASAWLVGKTLDQARRLHNSQIIEALAVPAEKIHCAVLAERAARAAIEDYNARFRA